jgi:hypothetical protein
MGRRRAAVRDDVERFVEHGRLDGRRADVQSEKQPVDFARPRLSEGYVQRERKVTG